MKSVRIVEGCNEFVVESIAPPRMRTGAAIVRTEAALLPPYMSALPLGEWMTPPRPFTPGQCAIGIVEEADACTEAGEIAALLRREGLYSSHLANWRRQYRRSIL